MHRARVRSSSLSSVGYDEGTRLLEIEFKNGSVYQYVDVPIRVYEDLMRARSKGRYCNAHVRDRYDYRKTR